MIRMLVGRGMRVKILYQYSRRAKLRVVEAECVIGQSPYALLLWAIWRINTRKRGWAEVRSLDEEVLEGWPRNPARRYGPPATGDQAWF